MPDKMLKRCLPFLARAIGRTDYPKETRSEARDLYYEIQKHLGVEEDG
jgi:hypothetical protein